MLVSAALRAPVGTILCRARQLEGDIITEVGPLVTTRISSVQSLSRVRLFVTPWTAGLPVHCQVPEFTQTHVHWVGDAIQPSHPLLSPSPPAFHFSQYQGFFKWVSSSHQVAKGDSRSQNSDQAARLNYQMPYIILLESKVGVCPLGVMQARIRDERAAPWEPKQSNHPVYCSIYPIRRINTGRSEGWGSKPTHSHHPSSQIHNGNRHTWWL